MKRCFLFVVMAILFSCASMADPHYVLDPPNHNLRGKTQNDDRPESDCDPVKKPDGSLEYKCVVHFYPEYLALLSEIERLRADLKACQQAHQ